MSVTNLHTAAKSIPNNLHILLWRGAGTFFAQILIRSTFLKIRVWMSFGEYLRSFRPYLAPKISGIQDKLYQRN